MVPRPNYRRNEPNLLSRIAEKRTKGRTWRTRVRFMVITFVFAGTVSLVWGLVRWGQASPETPSQTEAPRASSVAETVAPGALGQPGSGTDPAGASVLGASAPVQGPAIDVPHEIVAMLDLRRQELDRREARLRSEEERLKVLKGEVERLLAQYEQAVEAEERSRREVKEQHPKDERERKAQEDKRADELREKHRKELAKMYEAMEPEEAAVRLEKLPDRKAIAVLRLLKGKTAGAILAQVQPARAAKLTEYLLATP